jgi:hypothetical protein
MSPLFPTDEPTEMVFLLLRGEENKAQKVRSMNKMIIDWVTDKRLKNTTKNGSAFPAPSSINTMICTFFAATKDYYQWSFSQKDFNFDDGFNGFLPLCVKGEGMKNVSACFCFFCFLFKQQLISIHFCLHNQHMAINQTIHICLPQMLSK